MSASVVASVVGIASGINGLMGGGSSGGGAGNTAGGAYYDPFASSRGQYATQLNNLMANPGSVTQTPGYQFGMNQGVEALNRNYASTGQGGSGAQQVGLQNFTQGYAGQQYNNQESTLAQLSGATQTPMNVTGQNQLNANQQQAGWGAVSQGVGALGQYNWGNFGSSPTGYTPSSSVMGDQLMGGSSGGGGNSWTSPIDFSQYSDRRLKTNIKLIGKYKNGLNKYTWTYLWGVDGMGAMADEVEKLIPEAVSEFNGYKAVNYALLGE